MAVQSRLFWLFAIVVHALIAVTWLFFMPGGFPLFHARTLSNRVLPLLAITLCTYALIAARRNRPSHTRTVLLMLATTWLTASLACLALYPTSCRYLSPPALVICLLLLLSTRSKSLLPSTLPRGTYALLPLAVLVGILAPWTQFAPAPDTHPANVPSVTNPPQSDGPTRRSMITIAPGVRVQPSDGQLTLDSGRVFLYVQPLLTFASRSPDRCWIAFASRALRQGPARRLTSLNQSDTATTLSYQDDTTSILHIPQSAIPNPQSPDVTLESTTTLPAPIFSHLNTFTELLIAGHSRLFIEFSPCPGRKVEVVYQEYPTGRPARLAYVSPDRSFHIVQATSGEKGPYHDLVPPGHLSPTDPLTLTLYDNDKPLARITLEDFASQLSTQLSPTAGYGLPVNSIEFSLQSDKPSAAAAIFLSLASTSPGRGYDTVGHSPGTYRNRMRVELLIPLPSPERSLPD